MSDASISAGGTIRKSRKGRKKANPLATTAVSQLTVEPVPPVIASIAIPPRSSFLHSIQRELESDAPDSAKIIYDVGLDVTMTVALLKAVNGVTYGRGQPVDTLEQAVDRVGPSQLVAILADLLARNVLNGNGPNLTRFWDVSAKRAYAVRELALGLGEVESDQAQTFGLFCDVGIPFLLQRFTGYGETLKQANSSTNQSFTDVEHAIHNTDHALVGALMARAWGLSPTVYTAIRLHHDYDIFKDPKLPGEVARLVAMGLLAEMAIQQFAGLNSTTEWDKAGEWAVGTLVLSENDVAEWVERLHEGFASGHA
ncbi:MAG: HDOD domain-containing protein [Betaproteobacteria bacterium]|nr:HDOD domain-containing protein [Betaproteobacteria bacterium]